MARNNGVLSLVRALARISWRDVQSFRSVAGQNLVVFVAIVALQPQSAEFFAALLGLVIVFPLAADPVERIPGVRRGLWPLSSGEWALVRIAALLLNPLAWVALLILVKAGVRAGLWAFALAMLVLLLKSAVTKLSSHSPARWRWRLPAPPGLCGALMRLHWREMLRTLDVYVAFALSACTAMYRFTGRPLDPTALRIISLVVLLALSTQTQLLLSLDGRGAERYRQLPIRGWQILLAKDLAFLVLLALLLLPLAPIPGLVAALAVLAIGHYRSVATFQPQPTWRFTSGVLFPDGLFQIAALFAVGSAVQTQGLPLIALCILAWLASLFLYGSVWDRRPAKIEKST